jgi:hypothetical protein
MNQRTRLIVVIAAVALAVAILTVALMQCGARPAPATETPGATTATTVPTDGMATEPGTPTTTPGPTPTPTLTAEELLARELIEPRGQVTFSADECSEILETEPWCSVIKSAKPITRPEWEELFPQTDFFSVRVDVRGGEFPRYRNWLIVEQDGQRYTADTFDRLLAANGVTEITDENRELVAKAFALMTIGDYLDAEVVFTKWEEGEWEGEYTYDHYLKAWTEIQGLEIWWWFVFEDNHLRIVTRGGIAEYHVGDYIDVPFWTLPLPPLEDYYFTGG